MPKYNVWSISLCHANTGCIDPDDSSVIVTFPVPGFAIGELHSSASEKEDSSSVRTAGGSIIATLAAMLAAWLVMAL